MSFNFVLKSKTTNTNTMGLKRARLQEVETVDSHISYSARQLFLAARVWIHE
jgi:hypothetical protein